MKSTVEQLSPTRVRINVEVSFDELKPNFDRAYRKLAQQVRIPGFRPGKAPARILESRLGRSVVLDEVVNEAVPAKYSEAVSSGEVRPLGRPEIEVTKIEDGDLLAFTAEVDVRPEIALPAFDSIVVTVEDVEVSDSEVDEQLDGLRARFGTLTGIDRPVQTGDFVVIDLSATVDGEPIEEAASTGLSYEVGSGQFIAGMDDALLGLTAGESARFPTMLVAGEHAGREAQVNAAVTAVKERQLPEVDDEFAQLASEFDTVEELRADLRERLARIKRIAQGGQARDKVLEALLAATEVPLPPKVVESEVEVRQHDATHEFDHDEEALNSFLTEQGQSREEFDAELRDSAADAVKTQLVLDAVADVAQVTVTDGEMTERVVFQAQRLGIPPEEYVKQAQQAGQLGAVYAEVRRGKALATVLRAAAVTDASGNRVDVEALFAPAHPPAVEGTEAGDATESEAVSKGESGAAGESEAAGESGAAGESEAAGESGESGAAGSEPAGSEPAGSEPAGSEPAGSDLAGSDLAGST